MKKKTEIIFNDAMIDSCDDILNLKKGDLFYLSKRGTTPKSEDNYRLANSEWPEGVISSVINNINKKCEDMHIMQFKVVSVIKSYSRDYSISINNPRVEYFESITVKKYISIFDRIYRMAQKADYVVRKLKIFR